MSADQVKADMYAILSTLAEMPEGTEIIESHAYMALGMNIDRWMKVRAALLMSKPPCKPLVTITDSHLVSLTEDGRKCGIAINKALAIKADERRAQGVL